MLVTSVESKYPRRTFRLNDKLSQRIISDVTDDHNETCLRKVVGRNASERTGGVASPICVDLAVTWLVCQI